MRTLIVAAVATVALLAASAAHAHDPAVDELTARVDALQSSVGSQSGAIDDLYALIDGLRLRLDTGAVIWDQSAAVTDLYSILDRVARSMSGEDEE